MIPATQATATSAAVPGSVSAGTVAEIKLPMMMLNDSTDARIGATMPVIDCLMNSMKKQYASANYVGTVHGFLRAQNDPKATRDAAEETASPAATKDGWPKTIAFLNKNLGVD